MVTCGYLVLPALPGIALLYVGYGYLSYLWLPCVTGIAMLCARSIILLLLPQLPGGYLWLPCVTSVTRYCMTLCCVRGVSVTWWLPVVTLCYQRYLVLQDPLGCTWRQLPHLSVFSKYYHHLIFGIIILYSGYTA